MMSSENLTTRDRILIAAWKLLEDTGGKAVRMSDIAREAGVSRQALYLHFDNRADLLIATTRYMDDVLGVDDRLRPSREAASGKDRLLAFIAAWGGYLPDIQGVARALLAMKETDAEAEAAWDGRMGAMRQGCEAAIKALEADRQLADDWTVETATDLLWTMLSFQSWDQLTRTCGWRNDAYIARLQRQAEQSFIRPKPG